MIITRMEDKVLRFKKFFDLNFPKVKTFAWQLLKSEEDAEDIAQDIFVKLWEKPDLWLEREKLDSYLYTVVRNHIYNFLKHKAVEYDYLDVAAEKMQVAERGLPTPDDEFCAHELELFVQMALERMPEQRRRIFLMSREEGMTSPETTVYSRCTTRFPALKAVRSTGWNPTTALHRYGCATFSENGYSTAAFPSSPTQRACITISAAFR